MLYMIGQICKYVVRFGVPQRYYRLEKSLLGFIYANILVYSVIMNMYILSYIHIICRNCCCYMEMQRSAILLLNAT